MAGAVPVEYVIKWTHRYPENEFFLITHVDVEERCSLLGVHQLGQKTDYHRHLRSLELSDTFVAQNLSL